MRKVVLVADLDNTLVDSRSLDQLRQSRKWKECVRRLNEVRPFPQMAEATRNLRRLGVRIAVVTNSVSFYAEAVLTYRKIEYDALIAWHDTRLHKPNPEPIIAALKKVGADGATILHGIGDAEEDHFAFTAAGLRSLGAGWSPTLARTAPWNSIPESPTELVELVTASLH